MRHGEEPSTILEPRHTDPHDGGNGHAASNGRASGTLLDRLRAWKRRIILTALACTGLAALWLQLDPPDYTSSVVFFIGDRSGSAAEGVVAQAGLSPNIDRLFHSATSTEMIDHLIERFDLYTHFRIGPHKPFHHEKVSVWLLDHINVKRGDDNSVTITVKDEDRALAADIANGMFAKLQEMSEKQVISDLEHNMALYDLVIERTQQRSTEQSSKLIALVDELEHQLGNGAGPHGEGSEALTSLNVQLTRLAAQLSMANEDLSRAQKNDEIAAALIKKENLPRIDLVRKATQDIKTSRAKSVVLTMLVVPLAVALMMVAMITFGFKHGHEFTAYFIERQ